MLDMIANSLTTFRDESGSEIKQFHKILLRYVKSFRFYPDLLAFLGNALFTLFFPSL